jgi:hypothetical protein
MAVVFYKEGRDSLGGVSVWRAQGVRKVRLDRLQEYASAAVASVCRDLGLGTITPEALATAVPCDPKDGHDNKNANHLGRVRFFFDNLSDDDLDAILLSNGSPVGKPDLDEPHFYDGRHRFVAAVLRGDRTINVEFRWGQDPSVFLSRPVIAYLTGDSDTKPRGTLM